MENKYAIERREKAEVRADEIMEKLDYSKHDKRNDKKYVKNCLIKLYAKCPSSVITPAQWDEMFSHYSPYRGTY